jgi:hypothetical protein
MKKLAKMKKILAILGVALLGFVCNASAATVTDVYIDDAMVITNKLDIVDPAGSPRIGVNVEESYGENTLIPYDSHDGYGIVNGNQQFFDKTITITESDKYDDWCSMYLNFQVINNTNHAWSDYHLEFWNTDFTERKGLTLLTVNVGDITFDPFGNDIFDHADGWSGGQGINFWSDTIALDPLETGNFYIRWDWGNPRDKYKVGDVIGVRQVATTVPIPGALWLFASGLIGLLGINRGLKK